MECTIKKPIKTQCKTPHPQPFSPEYRGEGSNIKRCLTSPLCPSTKLSNGYTTYVAVVDPNGVFSGSTFGDGGVRFLSSNMDLENLRALFTASGGDKVNTDF